MLSSQWTCLPVPTPICDSQEAASAGDVQQSGWAQAHLYEGSCGTWQTRYAGLHARVLSRHEVQRYVVAAGTGGLADSLVGAITLFYFALLTDRAFQLDMGNGQQYAWGFRAPRVNWTYGGPVGPRVLRLRLQPRGAQGSAAAQALYDAFGSGDLRAVEPDTHSLHITSNAGLLLRLFSNPHHREQLHSWGLRPETAFGCACHFLFGEPTEAVQAAYAAEFAALTVPGTVTIGIQIRVGDSVFKGGGEDAEAAHYSAFFACADEVAAQLPAGRRVAWYLVSDSLALRRAAVGALGRNRTIVTRTDDVQILHSRYSGLDGSISLEARRDGFRAAVAEQWLLGLTHYQLISGWSGFGRVAVARGMRWASAFAFRHNEPRNCSLAAFDSLQVLSGMAPGI
eukprot:scaffold6.g2550.t1